MIVPDFIQGSIYVENYHHSETEIPADSWTKEFIPTHRIMISHPQGLKALPHIIFLTEHHNPSHPVKHDRLRNAYVINKLYKTNDLVLIEEPDTKQLDSLKEPETSSIPRKLNIKGWDSPEDVKAIQEFTSSINPAYELIKAVIAGADCAPKKLHEAIKTLESRLKLQNLQERVINHKLDNNQTLQKIQDCISQTFTNLLQNTVKSRTQHLIKAIRENASTKTLFIILGKRHVLLKSCEVATDWAHEQITLLKEHLVQSGHTYTILKPKKRP